MKSLQDIHDELDLSVLESYLGGGMILLEFDAKDEKRIKDLFKRGKGQEDQAIALAARMAKSIKDPRKAFARGEAAEFVLGTKGEMNPNPIADVFYARATELGMDITSKDAPKKSSGSKQIGSLIGKDRGRKPDRVRSRWQPNGDAILPLGSVNLDTGASKYFNVYDTWLSSSHTSTAEVWKTRGGKYKLIFTSGDGPIYKIGSKNRYAHDQTQRPMFDGDEVELVDWAELSNMRDLISLYGKKIQGYTYK